MSLILIVKRLVFFLLAFSLVPFAKTALADSTSNFTINNEPVPQVVATVNGTDLTADLLKREMIAYRLMISQQGQTLDIKDEEKIAQGLLMKAIDSELIYQEGLKKNIPIDPVTIDREINHIQSQFPDKKLFLTALAAQRLTFKILKTNIKKKFIEEAFIRIEIAPNVTVEDDRVNSFYEKNM